MRPVLVAFGLLVALAGCSAEKRTAALPATTTSTLVPQVTAMQSPRVTRPPVSKRPGRSPKTAESTAPAGSGEAGLDRFVAAVQKQLPQVALDRRDEEVEALGEQACDAIAAGRNATAAAGEIGAQGVPATDARKLVALASTTVC
jgi:hypothetical protein